MVGDSGAASRLNIGRDVVASHTFPLKMPALQVFSPSPSFSRTITPNAVVLARSAAEKLLRTAHYDLVRIEVAISGSSVASISA